jgi:hypothetical protein
MVVSVLRSTPILKSFANIPSFIGRPPSTIGDYAATTEAKCIAAVLEQYRIRPRDAIYNIVKSTVQKSAALNVA